MTKIIFILIPIILLTFSCTKSTNSLVQGSNAYTSVKEFTGIVSAQSTGEDKIKVCWNPIAGAKQYRIFLGNPGGCGTVIDYIDIVSDEPSTGCKFVTLQNKKPGTIFSFSVRACDNYGNPDLNNKTLKVTMMDVTAPEFQGLRSVEATDNPREVKLHFDAAIGDPERYEIYYCREDKSSTVNNDDNFCPNDSDEYQKLTKFDTTYKPHKIIKTVNEIGDTVQNIELTLGKSDGIGFGFYYHFIVKACDAHDNCDSNLIVKNVTPKRGNEKPVFDGVKSLSYNNQKIIIEYYEPLDQISYFKLFVSDPDSDIDWNDPKSTYQLNYNDFIKSIIDPASINLKYPIYFSTTDIPISSDKVFKVGARACLAIAGGDLCDEGVIVSNQITVSDNIPPESHGYSSIMANTDNGIILTFNKALTPERDPKPSDVSFYSIFRYDTCNIAQPTNDHRVGIVNYDPLASMQMYSNSHLVNPNTTNAWIVLPVDETSNMAIYNKAIDCVTYTQPDSIPPTFLGIKSPIEINTVNNISSAQLTFEKASDDSDVYYKIYRYKTEALLYGTKLNKLATIFNTTNVIKTTNVDFHKNCSGGTSKLDCIYTDEISDEGYYYYYGVQACDIPLQGGLLSSHCSPIDDPIVTQYAYGELQDKTPCFLANDTKIYVAGTNLRISFTPSGCTDLSQYIIKEKINDGTEHSLPSIPVASVVYENSKVIYDIHSISELGEGGDKYSIKIISQDLHGLLAENTWADYTVDDRRAPTVGTLEAPTVTSDGKIHFAIGASSDNSGIGKWYIFVKAPTDADFDYSVLDPNNNMRCTSFNSTGGHCIEVEESSPLNYKTSTVKKIDALLPFGLSISNELNSYKTYVFKAVAKDNSSNHNVGYSSNQTAPATIADYIVPVISDVTYNISTESGKENKAYLGFKITELDTPKKGILIQIQRKLGKESSYEPGLYHIEEYVNNNDNSTNTLLKSSKCVPARIAPDEYCVEVENANLADPKNWVTPTFYNIYVTQKQPIIGIDGLFDSKEIPVGVLNFNGWSYVKALGVSNDPASITLRWERSEPNNLVNYKYNVYRSNTYNGTYTYLETTTSTTYTDTITVAGGSSCTADQNNYYHRSGKTFYYYVRPVISGTSEIMPANCNFSDSYFDKDCKIEVNIPPKNMALIHRWMANKDICLKMNRNLTQIDRNNNYRCFYHGQGETEINGTTYYDIGGNYFVDRWESSTYNDTTNACLNAKTKPPIVNITQANAEAACNKRVIIGGDSKVKMTLLPRRVFIAASSFDDSTIETVRASIGNGITKAQAAQALESGYYLNGINWITVPLKTTGVCNGNNANTPVSNQELVPNMSNLLLTGSESTKNCVSKYGISDLLGNAWEWSLDKTSDGVGIPNQGSFDMNGFNLQIYSTSTNYGTVGSTANYIYYPVGLPLPSASGDAMALTDILPNQPDDYVLASTTGSGVKGVLQGGSYAPSNAAYPGDAGRFAFKADISTTTAPGNTVGYRCAVKFTGNPIWKDASSTSYDGVTLSWENTTMVSEDVSYKVYRSTQFDDKGVLACGEAGKPTCPTLSDNGGSVTFTDNSSELFTGPIQSFFYTIEPVMGDIESDIIWTTHPFDRQIEVMVPREDDVAMVHRWTYNRKICESMNKYVDVSTNYRCQPDSTSYFDVGPGNIAGVFNSYLAKMCNGPYDECYDDNVAKNTYGAALNVLNNDNSLMFWSKSEKIPSAFSKAYNQITSIYGPSGGDSYSTYKYYYIMEKDMTFGHWYKASQWNIHLMDKYFHPNLLASSNPFVDISVLISTSALGGIARSSSGHYFSFYSGGSNSYSLDSSNTYKMNVTAHNKVPADMDNWGNVNLNVLSNICYNNKMRLPRLSETYSQNDLYLTPGRQIGNINPGMGNWTATGSNTTSSFCTIAQKDAGQCFYTVHFSSGNYGPPATTSVNYSTTALGGNTGGIGIRCIVP